MVGIGYRRAFSKEFLTSDAIKPDFIEVAPENWMGLGGFWKQEFLKVLDKYPLFCHGLSLSVGSPEGIDVAFVKEIKDFLDTHNVKLYSEHLTFSKVGNAHLYDLLPIPFTKKTADRVVENIKKTQDLLERELVLENASYYTVLEAEIKEVDFINYIIEKSACSLLLDVNNVYVNAFNHKYNAKDFISNLNLQKVEYIHMAGHKKINEDLIIDTHGAEIIDPVFDLFAFTMRQLKKDLPVLLERDFNIPELSFLQEEINQIKDIKRKCLQNTDFYVGY